MVLPITGIEAVDWAFGALAAHAYLITFAVVLLENVFVAGAFTPGETTLLAAGFVASLSSTDTVRPVPLVVIAVTAAVIGTNISYFIGRRGGRPLLEGMVSRFAFLERRIEDAEGYFERRGSLTIFLARFAPGIKSFAYTIAGVCRMRIAVFEAYCVAGAVVYVSVMVALGYFFGSNFQALLRAINGVGYAAVVIALVFGAWVFANRVLASRRRAKDLAALEAAEDESCHVGD